MAKLSDYTTNKVFVNAAETVLFDSIRENDGDTSIINFGTDITEFDLISLDWQIGADNEVHRAGTTSLSKSEAQLLINKSNSDARWLCEVWTQASDVGSERVEIGLYTFTNNSALPYFANAGDVVPTRKLIIRKIVGIKYSEGGGGGEASNVAQFSVSTDTGDLVDAPDFISVDANPTIGEVTIRHDLNKAVWPTATAYSLSAPYVIYMSAIDFNTFTLTNALLNGQAADGVINVTLVW